jgi:metal transporter CNNM
MAEAWVWLGILFCLSQSAMLSGLNLAVFRLNRLQLETLASQGDDDALAVLALRREGNVTLATILWGNVAVNVLLTLLAESILAGVSAFLFSTVVITIVAEILPQAYFSKHALSIAARFTPVLKAYRLILWPVAKPVSLLLDVLVGREPIPWLTEDELTALIEHHAHAGTEVGSVEARGAVNFLALDDIPVIDEGEPIAPESIIALAFDESGKPAFPPFAPGGEDTFLRKIAASGKKWIIVLDHNEEPRLVFSAPDFLSGVLFGGDGFDPAALCHRPLVIRDGQTPLGQVLARLTVTPDRPSGDNIEMDAILVWTDTQRRIITGTDILGRLLHRISRVQR